MTTWTDLTFGVEIECLMPQGVDGFAILESAGVRVSRTDYTHEATPGWKCVTDGSLSYNGREFVSPVLRGLAGVNEVRRVVAALAAAGCTVDRSCGLHVHIGASSATVDQLKNLAKMFCKHEGDFDEVVPASRRSNVYAKSNLRTAAGYERTRESLIAVALRRIDAARTLRDVAVAMNGAYDSHGRGVGRYHKLNFQSLACHGTVEFRQAAGSVDAEKVAQWIMAVAQFSAQCFSVRAVADANVPTFEKFLRKFEKPVADFLAARRERLNRRAA